MIIDVTSFFVYLTFVSLLPYLLTMLLLLLLLLFRLGDCPQCYFKASSVHRSYYRCATIHGTNKATVTENVFYDAIGSCLYMEDGIEILNTISYNLGAHIHMIGPEPATGGNQYIPVISQSDKLLVPSDVAAVVFYITNVHNNVIGNAASGGKFLKNSYYAKS